MAYDIGPKIGIDGEAEFRAQINKINTSIKTLGTEMQVVTSAFAGQEKSTEALSAQNKILTKTVSELEDKLSQQKDMLARCAKEYGATNELTLRWQQTVNKTQTELNKANAQIDANEQALREDGKTVVDTAEKHEGAMSKIASAAKGGLGAAAGALKAVGTAAAAAVGAATTAVAGLVKASVEGYAETEQLMGGVETLYSESFEGVFENAFDAYKTAGLSANEYMETATGFAASLIQSLGGDTVKAADMADLAITDMADNANKMGSSMESIQNAYQGFAKQNYTMLDNLKLGYGGTKEEMQRLLSDAEKLPSAMGRKFDLSNYADIVEAIHLVQENMGIAGTTAAEASQTIEGSVAATKTAWDNLIVGLASGQDLQLLIPGLVESATTALNNIIPAIETTLGQIGPALELMLPEVVGVMSNLIETVLPQFVTVGADLLGSLVEGIAASLPALESAAGELVSLLVSGVESALPQLAEKGPGVIENFTGGITRALPGITSTAGSIITQLIQGINANLPALTESATSILGALASGLGEQLPTLVPAAVEMVLTLISSLVSNADKLVEGAIAILNGLAGGLVNSIPIIAEKAPEIVVGLVNAVVENVPKMLDAAVSLLQELATGIINNLPELGHAAGEIVGKIVSGVDELRQRILDIGGNIVSGVWDGISEKFSWLKEKVTGFLGGVVDGAKEFLGIKSPSKLFRDEIGTNIALGVAKGMQDSSDKAISAANEMAKGVYQKSKEWLDKNTEYLNLTLSEQIEVWETIQGQFLDNSQQWADAQEEILALQSRNVEGNAEDIIATTKKAMKEQELSINEQLRLWEDALSRMTEGSEQYAQAEDEVLRLRAAAAEEFAQRENAALQEAAKAQQEYDDALQSRAESIYKIYGLFDSVSAKSVSGDQLVDNLQSQVDSLESYYSNLEALSARGVSDALAEEIKAMGPKAAAQLEAFVNMSDAQLEEYTKLYDRKNQIAAEQAAKELEALQRETDAKIAETLAGVSNLFDTEAPAIGSALADGLANGIKNGTDSVVDSVVTMAEAAIDAAKTTLGVNSPSTVFAGIGRYMGLGIEKGWDEAFPAVQREIQDSLHFDAVPITTNLQMSGLTAGRAQPNTADLLAGMVNGMQTALTGAGGGNLPQSATIVLQAPDGTTLARWFLPNLRAAMRDDPEQPQ